MGSRTGTALYGAPDNFKTLALRFFQDRFHYGRIGKYIWHSRRIPSWTRGVEAVALARRSFALNANATIVEIGSFLGGSAVLLAGPRKLRGSGRVYCVDPFDGSGDAFSVPIYREILQERSIGAREWFDSNIRRAGLEKWVSVEQGRSDQIVKSWSKPIDLLVMDGDQSYDAVKATFDDWTPYLKPGGILALHNATTGYRQETHDGSARVGEMLTNGTEYVDIDYAGSMLFARKRGA